MPVILVRYPQYQIHARVPSIWVPMISTSRLAVKKCYQRPPRITPRIMNSLWVTSARLKTYVPRFVFLQESLTNVIVTLGIP